MIRQNRRVQFIILTILVCLVASMTLAYAVLSTTLNIIGSAEIQDSSWNVRFDNVQVTPGSVAITPTITSNTTLTFSANLTVPGDYYKFTVDIVNDGTIDAMIDTIIKTPELTTEQKKYLRYTVDYSDGQSIGTKQLLKAKHKKTISVYFSFRTDIPVSDLPSKATDLNLGLSLVYYQSDDTAHENYSSPAAKVVNGNINTQGSEVCIGTECFYIISNDGTSIKMLSKYNLHVGNICPNASGCTALTNPTGLQDFTAIGWFYGYNASNPMIGTYSFSDTNYWTSTTTSYPSYVYNEKSNIYNYIENYKTYLETNGVSVISAHAPSYEEFLEMGCGSNDDGRLTCSIAGSWVHSTSYWGGTARDSEYVLNLDRDGNLNFLTYKHYDYGIRPIIEIPLNEF